MDRIWIEIVVLKFQAMFGDGYIHSHVIVAKMQIRIGYRVKYTFPACTKKFRICAVSILI